MDFLILFVLIILNGLFAMSEMSVVSSRKTRLQQYADEGNVNAATALELSQNHGKFLSTVQVGITVIGIMNGAFGEATVGKLIESWFEHIDFLAEYAHTLSTVTFILGITFFSILFGELIPKKIALRYPEKIAMAIAKPMCTVAWLATPFVKVLNIASNFVMKVLGPEPLDEPPVTEEEIKVLMEQGAVAGVFEESEQELVSRVFSMDDRKVKSIMTPRGDISFICINDSLAEQKSYVIASRYSRFPVCDDTGLDEVLGIVHAKKLLDDKDSLEYNDLDKPLYVPNTLNITQLLGSFRAHHQHLAFVIDEYGHVEGMVTMYDVMEALMGDMVSDDMDTDPDIVKREDGSYLVAGGVGFDKLSQELEWSSFEPLDEDTHTLGGYIMRKLGKVPRVGDVTEDTLYKFEVLDMDKHKVDRVLMSKKTRD